MPSQDHPTAALIRAWDTKIRAGGSVPYVAPEVIAVVRRIHGLGPDPTDPDGAAAMERVELALTEEAG